MTTPTSAAVTSNRLALQRLYHWEKTCPDRIALSQPMGGGVMRDFTWVQLADETRRMAAHLKGLGHAPGSRIAILSKNCAYWMMSDFAIWMAGYVSVPLYPTLAASTVRQILEHSEAKLLFVGKLDGWEGMKSGVPAGLPCVSIPLSPPNDYLGWDAIVSRTPPIHGEPTRGGEELATIMYTSGTTGMPKGVMHSFATLAWMVGAIRQRIPLDADSRMLSFLPLAHIAERVVVEHGLLASGMHVYFADTLESFGADLQRARPTAFFSVPRLWVKFQQGVHAKMPAAKLQRLLKLPIIKGLVGKKVLGALGLGQCRFALAAAAPMPPDLLRWYERLGLPIVEGYGMTENGVTHTTLPGVQRPGT
ncbi:MAG: AMP-binding protein, partial [Aquabacterium sp.]|uniref:AMP-binding protein n=1 Tax=Aquabacterium sp. TaxID=1872578 RepID=UPI003BB07D74